MGCCEPTRYPDFIPSRTSSDNPGLAARRGAAAKFSFDEDYDENTKKLPQSRPETELTPLCYTIAKGRIMSIFGRISDLAYSREPVTYEQTLEIDRHLEEAHNQIPLILRTRSMEQSITDPPDLILRRFTLEILYQKCRCVLHRRYLAEFPDDMRYTYSRWVCITAAKQILRHQAVLHHESQPGGQLYREKRFPNSIQNTDYLLAAMIICLGLSPGHPREPGTNSQSNDVTVIIKGREDLLLTLETSLKDMRRRSADAQKAYAAMSIMLRCVKKSMQHAADLNGSGGQEFNTTSDVSPPPYDGWQNRQGPSSVLAHDQLNAMQSPFASLDVIEEMLEAPTNLDWVRTLRPLVPGLLTFRSVFGTSKSRALKMKTHTLSGILTWSHRSCLLTSV